jgi:3-oxoadipate enol-lactonase
MPYHQSGDLRLHYVVHNSHDPGSAMVVLLHGLGSCGEDWGFQIPILTQRFRTLTLDLRGHGRSNLPSGWPIIPVLASDVAGLMDALGEPSAHIVGLSLGGAVALQLAVDRPDLVRSLTAVNTFAHLKVGRHGRLQAVKRVAWLLMGRMDRLGAVIANGLFPEEQVYLREAAATRIGANPRRAYMRALIAVARFDLRPRLAEIVAPTLVIAGDRDTTVPMEAKLELERGIPGARLELLHGSGHATPLDKMHEFNALLVDFLDRVDRELV